MSKYLKISGWLECEAEEVVGIKKIISQAKERKDEFLTNRQVELYLSAWIFPMHQVNWTSFIFYGADVQVSALGFIKNLIGEITSKYPEINGLFKLSIQEEEGEEFWVIEEGKLIFDYKVEKNKRE